jgi:hypothetical protein
MSRSISPFPQDNQALRPKITINDLLIMRALWPRGLIGSLITLADPAATGTNTRLDAALERAAKVAVRQFLGREG